MLAFLPLASIPSLYRFDYNSTPLLQSSQVLPAKSFSKPGLSLMPTFPPSGLLCSSSRLSPLFFFLSLYTFSLFPSKDHFPMAHPSTREHNHDLEYIGIMKVNIDQSSYERIASRHREQDEVAFKNKETVEACLSKIVGRGGIGGYEREVLRAWAQELLELLSRPYTDSGYNFYVSGAKWMIERVEEFQRRLMWQMVRLLLCYLMERSH